LAASPSPRFEFLGAVTKLCIAFFSWRPRGSNNVFGVEMGVTGQQLLLLPGKALRNSPPTAVVLFSDSFSRGSENFSGTPAHQGIPSPDW